MGDPDARYQRDGVHHFTAKHAAIEFSQAEALKEPLQSHDLR